MLNIFSRMYRVTSFIRTLSSRCRRCLAVRLKWEMKQMLLQGWLTLSPGLLATVVLRYQRWQTPTLVILNCNGEQFGFKMWRVQHQCCSLQMIFIWGLVTGGKEFPQGNLLDMLLAVSGHYRPTLVGNLLISSWCWLLPVQRTSFPRHKVGEGEHGRLLAKASWFGHLWQTWRILGWGAHEDEQKTGCVGLLHGPLDTYATWGFLHAVSPAFTVHILGRLRLEAITYCTHCFLAGWRVSCQSLWHAFSRRNEKTFS